MININFYTLYLKDLPYTEVASIRYQRRLVMHSEWAKAGLSLQKENWGILNVNLEKNGDQIARFQRELITNYNLQDQETLKTATEKITKDFLSVLPNKYSKWSRFELLLESFVRLCAQIDPWSAWNSCDLVLDFYQCLSQCISTDGPGSENLIDLFVETTNYVVLFATELDKQYLRLGTRRWQFLSHIAAIISKVFNSIKQTSSRPGDLNLEHSVESFERLPRKQMILLYLVNKLNNIYFKIGSPQLCANIFKNFRPKSMASGFSIYPMKQQVEYKYLLGRYYFLNGMMSNAFLQLSDAFIQLHALYLNLNHESLRRNLVRILRYLTPCGLIVGKMPNIEHISQLDAKLAAIYKPLAHAVRTANLDALNKCLKENESYFMATHSLIIMVEKLPILVYRNLMKFAFKHYLLPSQSNRLPYDVWEKLVKASMGPTSAKSQNQVSIYNSIHTVECAENILITMINLNFLRGNCFPLLRLCVTKNSTNIRDVLPDIVERNMNLFPLHYEDDWHLR